MSELKLQQCRLDGRYDILECLGRGSYAEIFIARDMAAAADESELVVVKALNVFLQDTPDAELERTLIQNFQNEAVALDRVRHPHIINRLGHGTAIDLSNRTFHYIVLEYMPGGDLAAKCRQQPFRLERALFYLEQVSAGLAHAHSCGVIHRDIKPHNLLLTADEQIVKIADFGVAKLEASEGAITRVGTNVYAAPEHNPLLQTGPLDTASLSIAQSPLTPAADIYSLAKTVYTLLVGEPPRRFSHRPVTELPPPIAEKSWSKSVARVLERATQDKPADRYQTVQEFWEELADAAMPPTQLLRAPGEIEDGKKRISAKLVSFTEALPEAPPRPRFDLAHFFDPSQSGVNGKLRPRIVVQVNRAEAENQAPALQTTRQKAQQIINQMSNIPTPDVGKVVRRPLASSAGARLLVALILILAFSGMLLAFYTYFHKRWNPSPTQPVATNPTSAIGHEGVIIQSDVNLRPSPGRDGDPVGMAEVGSRVRVLSASNNWYEVQVLQHGRAKADPNSLDRGWINKKFLDLD